MTDDLHGKYPHEVVCLRSKVYSIKYVGCKKPTAKGVQKSVKKNFESQHFQELPFLEEGTHQNHDTIALTLS